MIKASLLATLVVSVLVTACAAETSDSSSEPRTDSEQAAEIGQTKQELCPVGMICTPPRRTLGFNVGDLTAVDGVSTGTGGGGTPPTFTCSTRRNLCDPYLTYDPATSSYICVWGCGGGGFGFARYNPCPSWAPNYVCTPYGTCSCY